MQNHKDLELYNLVHHFFIAIVKVLNFYLVDYHLIVKLNFLSLKIINKNFFMIN